MERGTVSSIPGRQLRSGFALTARARKHSRPLARRTETISATASEARDGVQGKPLPGRSGFREKLAFLREFVLSKKGLGFITSRTARNGRISKTSLFFEEAAIVSGQENIKSLGAQEAKGIFRSSWPDAFRRLGPENVLHQDGQKHAALRRLLAPAFTPRRLTELLPVAQEEAGRALAGWAGGPQPLQLYPEVKRLTTRLIIKITMGPQSDEVINVVVNSFGVLFENLFGITLPWSKAAAQKKKAGDELSACVEAIYDARVASADKGSDVLGTLLTAKGDDGELLSRAVVLDNVYGMFFAGHSTVSSSICNLLQYVARSPETTAAVAAEVLSWPEEERRKGGPLNLKRLTESPLLTSVVWESLRLAPSVYGGFRRATADAVVGGHEIKSGTLASGSADPSVYDEPTSFCPMRFAGASPPPLPMAFGAGPHLCMGADYAILLSKVVLVLFHRDFTLELDPDADHTPEWVNGRGSVPQSLLLAKVSRR